MRKFILQEMEKSLRKALDEGARKISMEPDFEEIQRLRIKQDVLATKLACVIEAQVEEEMQDAEAECCWNGNSYQVL